MGIKSQLKPTYSLALGSSEVNLLELTSAYGTLANLGVNTEAHAIRRILNRQETFSTPLNISQSGLWIKAVPQS